ncbi:MAG: RNA polymerase [Epulopiscium sp. Nele67-Bin001]|nr:MAG: RNA polymerase [Epulopiscium sp. Nuni2H_MBin001]OON93858.1 MAG: RNA polymerase [Epulopiscium sp. Nele67-Bin001]
MNEAKLIKRVKKGDVKAFEELIQQYEPIIYNTCMKILKNEHEAYDAAQEVCIKVWKQIDRFEGNSKFSTWVYRVTTNQCLDILRKHKSQKVVSIEMGNNDEGDWSLDVEDTTQDILKHIENNEMVDALKLALSELKEEHRQVILLRDVEDYSYEEISQKLSISLGTVKSRLSRGRQNLRNILLQDKEPFNSFWSQNSKEGIL